MNDKRPCIYCYRHFTIKMCNRHEESCKSNPKNMKTCPVCFFPHSKKGRTCGRSCANRFFRSGSNHPNWNESDYRKICFDNHKKECVVCGETKMIDVHHFNEHHDDNRPENLIPLCPTHHRYIHSKFKDEILHLVEDYVDDYLENHLTL